jgi:uncharacterized membrane protein YhaH (DUF805 family)
MTMPFRRYADFAGRSQRREYWMFVLLNFVVALIWSAVLGIVMLALYFTDMSEDSMMLVCMLLIIPYALYSLWVMIPGLAVTVRRLHDLDKSGWNLLWGLLPLVGGILLIVWYASEGTRGPNRFGPDPLADDAAQAFA